MDWIGITLQCLCTGSSLYTAWQMGNKSIAGPICGVLSQSVWFAMNVYYGLWGLMPVVAMMLIVHSRNLIKWGKELAE